MTLGLLLSGIVALLAAGWIVRPLLRENATRAEDTERVDLSGLRELNARQQMLLASLRDLEDDRAAEKLDDSDYEELRSRLSNEAIEVMKQLDGAEAARREAVERIEATERPLRYRPREEPEGDRR